MNEKPVIITKMTSAYIVALAYITFSITWAFFVFGYIIIDRKIFENINLGMSVELGLVIGLLPLGGILFAFTRFLDKSKNEYYIDMKSKKNKKWFYLSLDIIFVVMVCVGIKYIDIKLENKLIVIEEQIKMANPDWQTSSNEKIIEFFKYKEESNNFKDCNQCGAFFFNIIEQKELYKI